MLTFCRSSLLEISLFPPEFRPFSHDLVVHLVIPTILGVDVLPGPCASYILSTDRNVNKLVLSSSLSVCTHDRIWFRNLRFSIAGGHISEYEVFCDPGVNLPRGFSTPVKTYQSNLRLSCAVT